MSAFALAPCYTQGVDAPKKRRFRFGLRTLLIVVAIVALPLAWTCHRLRWIQQRQAFRAAHADKMTWRAPVYYEPQAPAGLWLFGESGVIAWRVDLLNEMDRTEAQRLFPESFEEYPTLANP